MVTPVSARPGVGAQKRVAEEVQAECAHRLGRRLCLEYHVAADGKGKQRGCQRATGAAVCRFFEPSEKNTSAEHLVNFHFHDDVLGGWVSMISCRAGSWSKLLYFIWVEIDNLCFCSLAQDTGCHR